MKLYHPDKTLHKNWMVVSLVTLTVILATLGIRLLFQEVLGDHLPLIFFILSSSILSIFYGTRAGIASLSISVVLACYFFTQPYYSLEIRDISDIIYLSIKYILGVVIILIINWVKNQSRHFLDHH